MVGTLPGGGYDLYGRLIARYIGRHIPGQPTVIVKNMPGAGHLRMANWLYNAAPRDGTVLATTPQSIAIEQALGTDGVQYDAAQVHLYRPRRAGGRGHLHLAHLEDAIDRRRAHARDRDGRLRRRLADGVLPQGAQRARRHQIPRSSRASAACRRPSSPSQRGEVEGGTKAWASMKVDNAQWLRDKQVNIILQYALERAPDLPDVPMMAELGLDARATAALKLFAVGNAMGRSIFATPGIPAERAAALRKAFMDTMNDPGADRVHAASATSTSARR